MSILHSFRTKNKPKCHEKVRENKDFCGIVVPSQMDNILQFNRYVKSDKMPNIINPDLGWLYI